MSQHWSPMDKFALSESRLYLATDDDQTTPLAAVPGLASVHDELRLADGVQAACSVVSVILLIYATLCRYIPIKYHASATRDRQFAVRHPTRITHYYVTTAGVHVDY